jgi:hypothetical protein
MNSGRVLEKQWWLEGATMSVLGEPIKIRLRGAVLRVHPLHLILDLFTLLVGE